MRYDLLKMPYKKSQLQMIETIAVLAVFFVVAILGYLFYSNILKSNLEHGIEESAHLNAIRTAQMASLLPEIQCSSKNAAVNGCIDLLKLEAALDIIQKSENEGYYFDKFGFSKIRIQEIYPDAKDVSLVYDRQMKDYARKIAINIPVSLFDPFENRYTFGLMTVEAYSR